MKFADVAENVKRLLDVLPPQEEFIFELLLAYGSPKSGVTLLKKGTRNLSKVPGEVLRCLPEFLLSPVAYAGCGYIVPSAHLFKSGIRY